MSYKTWHTYGYGIRVDDIKEENLDLETLVKFINMAPEYEVKLIKYIDECERQEGDPESIYELISLDTLLELSDPEGIYQGIGPILKGVMDECEHLYFVLCDDFNCVHYLLFTQDYPWSMGDKEKQLKEEDVENIFRKYISMITSKEILIDYWEVENGG